MGSPHMGKRVMEMFFLSASGSSLAAFALGGQNLLSQKSQLVTANTTFMTGNIQKMAEALWNRYHKGLSTKQRRAALLLVLTWSSYVLGGVAGAALASKMTHWSLSPVAALYLVGMLSLQIQELPQFKAPSQAPSQAPSGSTEGAPTEGGPTEGQVRIEPTPSTPRVTTPAESKA